MVFQKYHLQVIGYSKYYIPFDVTATGERFLLYDNQREDRILIFATQASLTFLGNSRHWFMDGTFSTVPPQFSQLYTLHGFNQGIHVVGAYCLLPNKRTETYVEMLTQIQHLINHPLDIESIMIDFEQSIIPALEEMLPLAVIKGCLFHLCKSIFRRVQSEGLVQLYRNTTKILD